VGGDKAPPKVSVAEAECATALPTVTAQFLQRAATPQETAKH
jgi:hypothetical protein